MSQKVIGHVKAPFGLVIDPFLQLCLRLIIAYPKKDIKSLSSTVAYAAIYSRMIKIKHTNKIKLTEEEKWEVLGGVFQYFNPLSRIILMDGS
jgi:dihydroneopterin aldolase